MKLYVTGALIGAVCGVCALLLACMGSSGLRRLCRVLRRGILKPRLFGMTAVVGAAIGFWNVLLCGSVNVSYFGTQTLCVCLMAAALTDLRRHAIYLPPLALFGVLGAVYQLVSGGWVSLVEGVVGAFCGAALLGIPYLLRREAVGVGDVALLGVCGMWLGFPAVVYLLARSLLLLGAVGVVKLLRKKATRDSEIPLAPFLLIGALL